MTPYQKAIDHADAAKLLGVPVAAERSEIRQAWKRRVLELHPDRGQGTNEEFVAVNHAYRQLLDAVDTNGLPTGPHSRNTAGQPMRASVENRVEQISKAEQQRCRELLEGMGLSGQVPTLIRRAGRSISYIFDEPTRAGVNHVAVLTGEMVDKRKIKPVHVEFVSAGMSKEIMEIPVDMRRELFPGTKSVRLHFGCDGDLHGI
ncbi:MAG: J domain-containing protein [Albidovulum sp.]